jgi:hypothetical protein
MGQSLSKYKYRRDCEKCRFIDREMDDLFDENTMNPLPLLEIIKNRKIKNDHVMNRIKNRKESIYKLYKESIK